jgi:hypothetical protein
MGFVEAGADFVIATIADLPGVLGSIEAAMAKGLAPGAAPSLLDHSVTGLA